MNPRQLFCAAACLAALPLSAQAAEDHGKFILESRLRAEIVDQDGIAHRAEAVTLRTRFGYESPAWQGFKFLVEGENILAANDRYNSTVNGQTTYPVVPDDPMTEVNRAQVSYASPHIDVVIGRQRINLGNVRFVGNAGFRQNEQTFDAARLTVKPTPTINLTYAYVGRVQRVFGPDSPQGVFRGDSHLAQGEAKTPLGQVFGYAFLLKFRNSPSNSSATYGLRLAGARAIGGGTSFTYDAEVARQTDFANNPANFSLGYGALALGLKRGTSAISVGAERLDGNGVTAFQTPLATLHAFQGWADVFLTTPPAGLREINLRASTSVDFGPRLKAVRFMASAHDFADADGNVTYGRELDASVTVPINRRLTAELAAAGFNGEGAFADRTKIWLGLNFVY